MNQSPTTERKNVGLMNQAPTCAAQLPSSSHPQLQQYQGRRLSRGRGIFRSALWL